MEAEKILGLAKVALNKFIRTTGIPVYQIDKQEYISQAVFHVLQAWNRNPGKPEAYFQKVAINAVRQKRHQEIQELRKMELAMLSWAANRSGEPTEPMLDDRELERIYYILKRAGYSPQKINLCLMILAEISSGNTHSDRIAKELGVSHQYVNRMRKQMQKAFKELIRYNEEIAL
jgi:hypothetical protein